MIIAKNPEHETISLGMYDNTYHDHTYHV